MLIFIASGGTGGHIMPAKATAEEFIKNRYEVTVLGDKKCLAFFSDKKIFNCYKIQSSKVGKTIFDLLSFSIKIGFGTIKSLLLIFLKRPKYVFCFGGYATFPVALASVIARKKLILHEQNAHLGKVNRIFAKYAYKIALSFSTTTGLDKKYQHKIVITGNPVRKDIAKLSKEDYKLPIDDLMPNIKNRLGYKVLLHSDFSNLRNIKKEPFIITVIGGSGGAKIFSDILPKSFFNLSEDIKENLFIFQQCRKDLAKKTFKSYKSYNISVTIDHFFHDMASLIAVSHLVIARSGSSTIFEVSAAKKPMILVPFAQSADDHQLKNATFFQKNNAALVIEEKDFNISNVSRVISQLVTDKKKLHSLSKNIFELSNIAASQKLCELIKN